MDVEYLGPKCAASCRGFVPAGDGDRDLRIPAGHAGSRPGGRGTFLCFAKEKYPKERRAAFVARRCASVSCDARRSRGLAKLASLKQRQPLSGCPCASRLLITAGAKNSEARSQKPKSTKTGHLASLWSLAFRLFGLGNPDFPLCMRRAAQLNGDPRDACLSEASLRIAPVLRAAQVARSDAKGRRQWGRLFFGDFLLATQKKVTAQSGAHPDMPRQPGRKQVTTTAPVGARPDPLSRTTC